ncbi:MAG: hypothetical protein QG608_2235 [Actinomycetota bacterium]|nr:hypothetical protein [Actinomycetota bacterium]
MRLNQLQAIGTHNSYHVEAPDQEKALRSGVDPQGAASLDYWHSSLTRQLGQEGIRQIELDVYADPEGGRYATPLIRTLTGQGPYDPVMLQPGFKILHLQDIDYHSNCLTLVSCLTEIKQWSDRHSSHVPIAILLELKDDPLSLPGVPYETVVPVPWDGPLMDQLDSQIRSVFPPRRLITPDDVRGSRPTLESAVLNDGWPTVRASRGRTMFLMENDGAYRTTYLQGHPTLQGRAMFTHSTVGQPDAAFLEENDPTGENQERITDAVRRGYVVRTRADADTVEARTGDTTRSQAALASGAQWVSTDYPASDRADRYGTGYVVRLPEGAIARCNPITAPARCRPPHAP